MRVAHWSDLHITADPRRLPLADRLGKRFAGWVNLTVLGRFRRFADAPAVAEALARDLAGAGGAGAAAIVFSGDVTGQSLEQELAEARRLLAPLADDPRVLGIPGNHDAYTAEAFRARRFSAWFGAWERAEIADLAAAGPPGARGAAYPIVRLPAPGLALVAIDVAVPRLGWDSSGECGAAQLAALDRALGDPRLAGRRILLVVHYAPRRQDGSPDTFYHGLRDADALLAIAGGRRVSAILCGHMHRRFVLAAGAGSPVPILCAGSVTDVRRARAYHVYDLDGDRLAVEVRRYDPAARAFAPDPALAAEVRLA